MLELQFERIERLITEDLGKRGLCHAGVASDFSRAVYSLWDSRTIIIVTGFCIRDFMKGETDGLPGAVVLGNTLEQLGKKVVLATDSYSYDLVQVCCALYGFDPALELVPLEGAAQFCSALLEKYKPSHVIGLERPSRAKDGCCYSMRGEDLSDIIPDTDGLFSKDGYNPPVTVGIGDGGNELGMGKIAAQYINKVPNGSMIWAATVADYLIPVAVSNWGAYGLSAALSMLSARFLIHHPSMEKRLIAEIIRAGGVDGCTKKAQVSVDGIGLQKHMKLVRKLGELVDEWIISAKESATEEVCP